MAGENDLNQQNYSMYRKIENFYVSSSQAIQKRSGTKLALFSDGKEIFPVSTSTEVYIFYSDKTYTVISLIDFSELKANSPSPIEFANIKTAKIERSTTNDKQVLNIFTKGGWYKTDNSYALTGLTLTGVPAGVDLNLAVTVYGRGVIASKTSIYFSTYGAIQDFTVPSAPTPTSAFTLNQQIGFDTDITDIIFFNESIFIGTRTSIYVQPVILVNPFAPNQIPNNLAFRKLHSIGVNPSTFTIVGKSLVFANDRGVYIVTHTTETTTSKSTLELKELTESARHITSEDNQSITAISSYFRKENVFYALRNDGIIFTCTLVESKPYWSRRVCSPRVYTSFDEQGHVLISQDGTYYYAEQNTEYPYLSDNKLRFSEDDEIPNLEKFSFLDACKIYTEFILEGVTIVDQHRFTLNSTSKTLLKDVSYTIRHDRRYINMLITSVNSGIYTHNLTISTPFVVISKFISTIDISSIKVKNSEIYVTYAKINENSFTLETIKATSIDQQDVNSFFAVAGLKYEASAHILIRNNADETKISDTFKQIGVYCTTQLVAMTYTEEGIERTEPIAVRFSTTFNQYTMPTVSWKNYKHLILSIPVGHSGVILSVGPILAQNTPAQK